MRGRLFFQAPRLLKRAWMSANVRAPGWLAGKDLHHGAHLVGQGTGPSLCSLTLDAFFRQFLLDFKCHFGLLGSKYGGMLLLIL